MHEQLTLEADRPPTLEVDAAGDPARWAAGARPRLREIVAEHGSVLVRGLGVDSADRMGGVATTLMDGLMVEKEAFAPREAHPGGIYSSSAWPPNQQMCMHHELSYRLEFPNSMIFACVSPATEGGAISIADSTIVRRSLPADLVRRFEREGWMLVRNYTDDIGLSVSDAFGTDDRSAIEGYCRANAIELEWQPDGGLRTRQTRGAVHEHPGTGERCWFNQIAFLNEWTMNPEVHEFLVDMMGPDGLPFNTRFGNGDPIGEDVVKVVNDVYDNNAVRVTLESGDLLVVDNIRTAHSREPFTGPREVLVAMADPVRCAVAD